MQDFSAATYKNILDHMLSLVPDTYDERDTSPIQTAVGPAAYVLEGFYLSLDLVQKQAFVQTAPEIRWIFWQCWPVSPASRLPPL